MTKARTAAEPVIAVRAVVAGYVTGSPMSASARPRAALMARTRSTDQLSLKMSTAAMTAIVTGTARMVVTSGSSRCSGPSVTVRLTLKRVRGTGEALSSGVQPVAARV